MPKSLYKTFSGVTQTPENVLYKLFGINAKALIDHAYGKEDTCISDIKAYKPKANSISNSQILFEDYNYKDAYIVLKEMVLESFQSKF